MTIAASKQGRCPVCAAALPKHGEGCWVPGSKVEIGNCYEEAFNALMAAPPQAELLLVHGEPTLTCPPFIPYGHAWLELPSAAMVLDVSSQRALPLEVYYAVGRIDPTTAAKYDFANAVAMAQRHRTFGPWHL